MKTAQQLTESSDNNLKALSQTTSSRTRAQRIFETMRERISLLVYPPGTKLRERELAEKFQVSRTPIRSVLQRLEFEGLTYSRQGHGTIVTSIDLYRLIEVYKVRMKLAEMFGESSSLENAAGAINIFDRLIADCEKVEDQPDFYQFGLLNIGLHEALQSLTTNTTLQAQIDTLFYQTVRMWFLILSNEEWDHQIKELTHEMRETRRFLKQGDLESMGYIRRSHLSLVVRKLEQVSDKSQ